ncbi:U-box domain-containing protein 33 isoform X2 [Elaeis guineensis]|uniref:U-box domain-containing protein 33 isoform X2 n=1 Tax=Elaeis guineensis var. tenera TaxID=51953 RepID=A0A6I9SHB5_ELAGV|nr:U-box domain-containing protein 33 isoform X2 [Elaeis guineensis]
MNTSEITSTAVCEIQEVKEEPRASEPREAVPPSPGMAVDGDKVYVAVGESSSSMDALLWALRPDVAKPRSVCLIHVHPEVHYIPTPLGIFPKHQLNDRQVERFTQQEKTKIQEMLQKYLNSCQSSKVEADTHLIESDQIVKAIVGLIPVLNIKRLIVGATKANLRGRRNSKAAQIHKNAPDYCEVEIICDGREVKPPSPIALSSPRPVTADRQNHAVGMHILLNRRAPLRQCRPPATWSPDRCAQSGSGGDRRYGGAKKTPRRRIRLASYCPQFFVY